MLVVIVVLAVVVQAVGILVGIVGIVKAPRPPGGGQQPDRGGQTEGVPGQDCQHSQEPAQPGEALVH